MYFWRWTELEPPIEVADMIQAAAEVGVDTGQTFVVEGPAVGVEVVTLPPPYVCFKACCLGR